MMPDLLNNRPNLADPAVLSQLLRDDAAGLEQQAIAAHGGSAMGGAPFPEQFYRRAAMHLCLAADMLLQLPKPPDLPPLPPGPSGPRPMPEPVGDMGSPPRPKRPG